MDVVELALVIAKLVAFEAPLPGFVTVTGTAPTGVNKSLAVICAVTCVELPNVVVRFEPFHCTVAPETKFVPFTIRVSAPEP